MEFSNSSDSNVLYKNVKENTTISEKSISGKTFLVEEPMDMPKWELMSETKKIGKYLCYKAKYSYKAEQADFSSFKFHEEEGKEESKEDQDPDQGQGD